MDYEGTSISMVVTVNGNNQQVPINMEDTMELMDIMKKRTMLWVRRND